MFILIQRIKPSCQLHGQQDEIQKYMIPCFYVELWRPVIFRLVCRREDVCNNFENNWPHLIKTRSVHC